MKLRQLFLAVLLINIAFSNAVAESNSVFEPRRITGPGLSRGPAPEIRVEGREISITLPEAEQMQITIFSLGGRRLARKKVASQQVTFRLPRSARNKIIVQIEAGPLRFFSQSVAL